MSENVEPRPEGVDPSEVPGAIVIRPERNPNMVYDTETKRVTDKATGESFGMKGRGRNLTIYGAAIRMSDGKLVHRYVLKPTTIRGPDGIIRRKIWEVLGAKRRGAEQRFMSDKVRLGEAQKLAEAEAQEDSIERLAQFLRAHFDDISLAARGRVIGDIVIVDRRMDDTEAERYTD